MDSIWKNPLPPFYPDQHQPITEEEDREDARIFCEAMGIGDNVRQFEPMDQREVDELNNEYDTIRREFYD